MPTIIHCPTCQTQVGLPEGLLGQLVQCPQCRAHFTTAPAPVALAPAPTPSLSSEVILEIAPDTAATVPALAATDPAMPAALPDALPEALPQAVPEIEERDRGERRPRRRERRPRLGGGLSGAAAEDLVFWPALAMVAVGAFAGVLSAVSLIMTLVGFITAAVAPPSQGRHVGILDVLVPMIAVLITLMWSGLVMSGGNQMRSMKGYNQALFGAIVALLPCHICCVLGLPVGLWSLIILLQDNVRKNFD